MRWRFVADACLPSRRFRISQQRKIYFVGSATWGRSVSLLFVKGFDIMAVYEHEPGQRGFCEKWPKLQNSAFFPNQPE